MKLLVPAGFPLCAICASQVLITTLLLYRACRVHGHEAAVKLCDATKEPEMAELMQHEVCASL